MVNNDLVQYVQVALKRLQIIGLCNRQPAKSQNDSNERNLQEMVCSDCYQTGQTVEEKIRFCLIAVIPSLVQV
jgi:hypothetical protein